MKNLFLTVALFASVSAFADMKAQLAAIDASETACLNSPTGQSDDGMHQCTAQAYQAADALLNSIYTTIMNQLKSTSGNQTTINQLIASEKAWIAYRDADAAFQGSLNAGGTLQTLDSLSTDYSKTKARALELDAYNTGITGR